MKKTRSTILYIMCALLLAVAPHTVWADEPDPAAVAPSKVKIYGNVYGGGELAQVVSTDTTAQLIQDADLADLFTTHADHVYTTYVHLGTGAEVFGRVFGGGRGAVDSFDGENRIENPAGEVIGQTDVALDGATVWSEIYGGGEMADVYGNTLVHFKKGKAGHNAFGGGLGVLGKRDGENNLVPLDPEDTLPDNRYEPLASADIKRITEIAENVKKTGESFVVFDGQEVDGVATYTHYEFKTAKTFEIVDGAPVEHVSEQFSPADPEKLFSIDHNIYGGGMTASKVEGKTFVHINYGMVNEDMMNFEHDGQKVWSMIYNSIANAQFCVFGGGYGYHTDIEGDANVTMDVQGSGQYKYINEFTAWFAGEGKRKYHWDTNIGDPEAIYNAADESTWSHGAPGRSCMDIIGGGYNGKVLGSTNVIVGGDVVLRKVYGGGYYSSVGHTNVTIRSGIFNRVYGGGLIGNVYGKANLTLGQQGVSQAIHDQNLHLLVKDAVYGGNDVSGTVGTTTPGEHKHTNQANGVTYNIFHPVDDDNHGVRLNIYGGLVLGDVYGAGNGNHPGYGNPNYMQFGHSQHPSENYRKVIVEGQTEITNDSYALVYKYRPRTGRVVMNLQGNAGENFNDDPQVDKVRIWGRTFGGGNSCNVGIWDGTKDDNAEVYADDASSWHPGDNFQGGGTISINVGDHVQLGNRNDSHTTPNGLFMGSNGEHMITQHLDPEKARYYHQYYDMKAKKYYPGFVVYEDDAVTPISRSAGLKAFTAFINNILTKTDSVKLKVADNVTDVWMSNFVGGGYRGSMQAKTATGQFRYELPQGVTVGHSVVGGAFNAHIIYRVYATNYGDGTYRTDANGNYLYETIEPQQGVKSKAEAEAAGETEYDYIKKLYAEGHEGDEEYKTGYLRYNFDGGIMAHNSKQNATSTGSRCHKIHHPDSLTTADFTSDGGYLDRQDSALLYLKLQNQLHPIVHEATDSTVLNVHGGIVYGGCFLTGFVDGDTWLEYDCSLSPLCTDRRFFAQNNDSIYGEVADMVRNNALNIFGAGYGEDTHTMGDVYLHINSQGINSRYPFIYNAFGGGNLGTVAGSTNVYYNGGQQGTMLGSLYGGGYKGDIGGNTYVELVQGFLVNVYGGSRQANIDGAAHVWAYDGSTRQKTGVADNSPLIICNLYGGNDISGTIRGTMPATWTKNDWTELNGKGFNSYVQIAGTNPGAHGFPLVGSVYGGGNGEMWSAELGDAPDVERVLLEIDGGTTLRAFGGGNQATVTNSLYIFTNATQDNFANYTFSEVQKHVLEHKFFSGTLSGYTWNGYQLLMDSYHAFRLFGGNNVAEMKIQPQWNLKDGKLGSVYAGGNLGNMTCPDGLTIHVKSPTVEIDNLFGGCRMADVQATNYEAVDGEGNPTENYHPTFDDDHYGATANVSAGRVHNVYGGNDVAGHVYNGTNVNITGGTIDNVYGAGNGDYIYQYNTGQDAPAAAGTLEERMHADNAGNDKYIYYTFRGTKKGASAMEKLQAINTIRPNVDKAYLYIQGTESSPVMLTGNVYCGGNATTVCGDGAYTKLDIGSYCTLDGVYMGSNGEQMTTLNALDHLCQVNAMSLNTQALLSEYMSAVAMPALPRGFALSDTITNTYIGTFCLGGNRGSMTSDQPVHITLPSSLTIYNKVVGGCNEAYLAYRGNTTTGGFTTYNADRTLPKIRLDIYSQFVPKKLQETDGVFTLVDPIKNNLLTDKYCNVYGGCYTRGYIYGDVEINMYSDMIANFDTTILQNNIDYNETNGRPVFSVFGGGYGPNTVIYGNTHIRLLNNHNIIGTPALARDALPALKHPSVNAIYGGGEQGKMIGTSTIHIADGTVYSNVVGGALNGSIYGNTEILVGYPSYYEVQKTGEYLLKRSNFTAEELAYLDGAGNNAVKQSIFLTKGDRINAAVYQAIKDWDVNQVAVTNIVHVDNKVQKNWDDISINVKGGIYGGGYARENVDDGQTALANTVLKFTGTYNLATAHPELWSRANTLTGDTITLTGEYDYGGNATIWVQDEINASNWVNDGKEHITITTELDDSLHIGKGGIFGDGHSSLVAAFRSAAVEGYGYAEHPANAPKLLNTFQRFDILQIRDCAMKMYGQIDVATGQNDPTLYSVSRISELMLNSHINDSTANLKATSELNARNVIDFYNPVHFLGSITSEVTFKPLAQGGSKYHDIQGNLVSTRSYFDYKNDSVAQNYDYSRNAIRAVDGCKEKFGARNAGTAKNMIRIDDPEGRGVHLKVVQENNYAVNGQGVREEQSFYGPLSGVFEFELTHANARGGGYVYSNNLHEQTVSGSDATIQGSDPEHTPSFLQTSGNVFFKPVYLANQDKRRYVFDDCYPIPFSDRGTGKLEKAHYWFVEGDGPTWCSYPQEPTKVNSGTKTITIETAEQLAWVYDYIDHGYDSGKEQTDNDHYDDQKDKYPGGFEGWIIQLGNDINLEQLTILDQREMRMIWCPIADQKETYFKGTFDGKGHKIDGMLLDVDFITTKNTYGEGKYSTGYDHYFGLFAKTLGATIQNVELSGALVKNIGGNTNELVHIGTLITEVDGTTVVNCSVEQTDTITSLKKRELEAAAAFICHTAGDSSYISHNFVSGSIYAVSDSVTAPISGFISRLDSGSTMEHCYSLVDVHAKQVAGLADTVQGGAFLEHSYYAGKLTLEKNSTNWGAIVVNASNANIKHCYYDKTKNPEAKGCRGTDNVFKQATGYTNWSTYGLTTQEMTSAASGAVWRSCYDHDHTRDGETHPCEIDGADGTTEEKVSAWNKGVWTYLPGLYPILKAQDLDCSALTTAFVMPTASSFDMTTHTDLIDEHEQERWFFINKNFQLPAYGTMSWSVANNTLLLDSVSNKAQNKVNAHLYLGGPDVLSINCDDIHRQMQDIYITREDINNPADIAWYDTLSTRAKNMLAKQLYVANFTKGMLRNKEVTNISKKNDKGVYEENGFDGDLHIWNREGDAGTVTNPRQYKVNGTITYYTGYTNPYLWNEVNIPYEVDSASVYRTKTGNEYRIDARIDTLAADADGGNFWLRSFADGADVQFGGSVFQQGWLDPAKGENIGHRPSILRFPQTMIVNSTKYLAGDYWCYAQNNTVDGTDYHNGGSEIRFYSTPGNIVYGTHDWEGQADHRGVDDGYSFHVYGNPTLGNIQLEGYYWILESERRDTTGVNDTLVKPVFGTDVAQWFSLQQDPVIAPLGIWVDGPENFRQQALDEGGSAPLRISPLHEKAVNEQYGEKEASFTASGHNGLLGVFSYEDQEIFVYDPTGRLVFQAFVRANTGFTIQLTHSLFIIRGSESPKQVKVMI